MGFDPEYISNTGVTQNFLMYAGDMTDDKKHLATASGYVTLKKLLSQRREYLKRSIEKLEQEPPVKGGPQDHIIVSREAMIYILERGMDGVEIAEALNETINEHNLAAKSPAVKKD